jgi:uncharacterized membrane protein
MAGESGGRVSASVTVELERPYPGACAGQAVAAGLTAAAVLSAVVLRWFHLEAQSLYADEGQTIFAASLSPAGIVRFTHGIDHPPLYFLLLHYWIAVFGNTVFALRALSALFGTLSLPVFYLLAKRVLKDSMAVAVAMWLFAFSMMQVWYSQEARSYELASFFALVGIYGLVVFLEKRSAASFAAVVLSTTAMLYLHNMMLFYVIALNVVWLIYPSERAWRTERLKDLLVADVVAGVLYLPWLPRLLNQANTDVVQNYFWSPRPTIGTLLRTLRFIAGFNIEYLSGLSAKLLPLPWRVTWALVVGGLSLLCVTLLVSGLWGVPKPDRRRNVSLLLYCLVPILTIFALSQITTPLFIDRIFINSSLSVPLLFSYPVALYKGQKQRILCAVLGAVLAATALSALGYLRYEKKDDWRGVTRSLLKISERNRLIVFVARTGEVLFDYYAPIMSATGPDVTKMGLPTSYHEKPLATGVGMIRSVTDLAPLQLAVQSRKYSEIDLVLSHESREDPNELVLKYLSQVFIRRNEQRFTGIRIVRFKAPPQLMR